MTFDSLITAYLECRKHKRNTSEALDFEADWERNLLALHCELNDGSYRPKASSAFVVHLPVQREVFAATFADRIVHHWLIARLMPLFEEVFCAESYSCRPGKGTLYGIRRIQTFIAECKQKHDGNCWVFKGDLQAFFMSIDRQKLLEGLEPLIRERYTGDDIDEVLCLTRMIALHDPAQHCRLKCDRSEWTGLPKDKSLFYTPKGRGLPIGNLTSQWFGNFYLTAFDRFVTQHLGVEYYGRYVDDFVIVHHDKEFIKKQIPLLEHFLKEELGLTLHPRKLSLQHASKGVRFLGTVIHSNEALHVGKRTKTGMYNIIRRWNSVASEHPISPGEIKQLCTSLNSYWGLMRHCNSYRLRKRSVTMLAPAIREQIIVCGYKKVNIKQLKQNKNENYIQ